MPLFAFPLSSPFGNPPVSAGAGTFRGRDLAVDPETGDLLVSRGDLFFVRNGDAVRQEANIRLRFLLSEWFLDKTVGVPHFQQILVKSPNLAAIRTVLRDEINAVAGIRSIARLDLELDSTTRTLQVSWSATTDLGELIESEVEF